MHAIPSCICMIKAMIWWFDDLNEIVNASGVFEGSSLLSQGTRGFKLYVILHHFEEHQEFLLLNPRKRLHIFPFPSYDIHEEKTVHESWGCAITEEPRARGCLQEMSLWWSTFVLFLFLALFLPEVNFRITRASVGIVSTKPTERL